MRLGFFVFLLLLLPRAARGDEVLAVHGRDVIVDLGAEQGVEVGSTVEIYTLAAVDLGLGEVASSEQGNVIGTVTLVAPSRASVHLGMHEQAFVGWKARTVKRSPTANRSWPPRGAPYFEAEGTVRPFLGQVVGLYAELGVGYRFAIPLRVRVRLDPLLADVDQASVAAAGIVSYDSRLLEIGLGAGYASRDVFVSRAAAVVPTVVRIGAVDGVSAELTNTFFVADGKVAYGSFKVSGYAPIAESLWFCGGLTAGRRVDSLDIGLRFLARGSGGPGSIFLSPRIGAVEVGRYPGFINRALPNLLATDDDTDSSSGPVLHPNRDGFTLALGAEFRL